MYLDIFPKSNLYWNFNPMQPLVSIITITKNRKRFFPHLINTVMKQTYPKDMIDWVIIEDGDENVSNLVSDLSIVRYEFLPGSIPVGEKRNFANSKAKGDYILYFDDDNYAFPSRIESSIDLLLKQPSAEIVGSSEMYVLDNPTKKIYVTGPFSKYHATASTWCFRKSLLEKTAFNNEATFAEEACFLKDWSIPLAQLPKQKSSLSFDHGKNTFSKQHLRASATEFYSIREIIEDPISQEFYNNY